MSSNPRGNLRQLLAQEAARLIADHGISDYRLAKRKAAERLGVTDRGALPRNTEIEAALEGHLRLFGGDEQAQLLERLRGIAHEAMEFFADFEPRLVGSVLNGTASSHSDVNLHLFADAPEQVVMRLLDGDIPYQQAERRIKLGRDRYASYPVFRFFAGEVAIDVTVFPPQSLRQPPSSPIDGRPMRRARIAEVAGLL